MAVPTGTASMLDIQNEFGGSNPISLSEYYGAASGVPTSGTISIDNFRGKSAPIPYSIQDAVLLGSYRTSQSLGWPYSDGDNNVPANIRLSNDGTKIYLAGPNTVYQGTLSTPWSIGTTAWDDYGPNYYWSLSSQNGKGIDIKSDGTRFYAILDGNNDQPELHQWNLSTAWDISTAPQYSNASTNVRSVIGVQSTYAMKFKPDGTKLYVLGAGSLFYQRSVHEMNLSTAWDISTASSVNSVLVSGVAPYTTQIDFSDDGTKLFALSDDANVYQWNLSTAWSVGTASYASISKQLAGSSAQGMIFGNDGEYLYKGDAYSNYIYQYRVLG